MITSVDCRWLTYKKLNKKIELSLFDGDEVWKVTEWSKPLINAVKLYNSWGHTP